MYIHYDKGGKIMPFPNFHSGRVKDPNLFARIVVLQTLPNGVMIYGGPLKTDPSGSGKPQAYRFPKSKFTAAQAKAWLKEHNIKTILFEPATGATNLSRTFSTDKDILSTGTWNSMQGKVTFTKEDLQEIADNISILVENDPEFKNGIPLKINLFKNTNPENTRHGGQPSFGWIKELKVKGEKLFAKITNIPKLIKEMIENKQYREVSSEIGFNRLVGNERLRKFLKGVALLGVELPAVENLNEFEQFYSLNTEEDETSLSLTVETNTKTIPEEEEEEEEMDLKELEQKLAKLQKDFDTMKEENATLKKENEKIKNEKKEADEKLAKSTSDKRSEEIKTFVKERVKEGKILPANEASTVSILESLSDEKTVDFSKDGKTEKVSPRELRQQEIEASPNVVEFSEKLKKEKEGEAGKDLAEETKSFKKQDEDEFGSEKDQKAHHIVLERTKKFKKDNPDKDVPEYEGMLNQVYIDYPELG